MRANERTIILGVAVAGLVIAFYLLVLGPERDKASELSGQIDQLHASISAADQQTSYGEQARQEFPKFYGRMVVLGKAVPAQSDTASMLVQLNSIADRSKMDLRAIALSQGGAGEATTAPTTPPPNASSPTAAATTAASTASTANSATPTPTAAAPAPATEASAATVPIGSVVGPAGLPTLPYDLTLKGSFFDVPDFIGKIDGLVRPVGDGAQLSPDGRLLTINGFALQIKDAGPPPELEATFVVTAYSTGDQGLTAGASPTGPAPTTSGQAQTQPASAVVAK